MNNTLPQFSNSLVMLVLQSLNIPPHAQRHEEHFIAMSSAAEIKRASWSAKQYPFTADYNDHFETPLEAYRDICWILDIIQPDRKQHAIYDPYYCNGRTSFLLNDLGFAKVYHDQRDFYKDVEQDAVPAHDTLITNPPYSDDHKKKCLDYCIKGWKEQDRSFFILMPNYVAARDYFRTTMSGICVFYLLPQVPYEYAHPDGTGHDVPPFNSLWFCGVRSDLLERVREVFNNDKDKRAQMRLFYSTDELKAHHVIPSTKRPNPKQRRKRKQQEREKAEMKINKMSKHRDTTGSKTKRRF